MPSPKGNARSSGYKAAADEWYTETPGCVDLLLDAEPLEGLTWDTACGGGNIPNRLAARGMQNIGTDIADRARRKYAQVDFLKITALECPPADNILSNPPFSLAVEFVNRALWLVPGKIIVLQRLAWLEGKARGKFFVEAGLSHVWVHSSRQSMPPGGSDIVPKGGAVAFAWYVFRRPGHVGPPTLGFLP